MKKFIVQAVLLVAVIAVGLILFKSGTDISDLPFLPQKPVFKTLQIKEAKLKVEIADTQPKRNKGLGGRQNLASDEGMLFIFPKADKHQFWMKGLTFPLDFVWIREDKVVDLLQNVQPSPPNTPDSALSRYGSKEDADKVLEVNAGTIQRLDIKTGDAIKIE